MKGGASNPYLMVPIEVKTKANTPRQSTVRRGYEAGLPPAIEEN